MKPSDGSSVNPYAPTSTVSDLDGDDLTGEGLTADGIRRRYLKHEASVRSVGWLYLIPGFLLLAIASLVLLAIVAEVIVSGGFGDDLIGGLAVLTVYGALGGLQLHVGWGLRRLSRPARRWAIIFSAIGLVVVPFGTIISVYILYLLLCEKGKTIFSDDYKEVIRQTPHIQYQTSIVVKVFALILLLVLGFGVVGLFLG